MKHKIYLKLKETGEEKATWPRKIILHKRNNEDQLESTEHPFLTHDEFSCWPKGLQIGLKDRFIGDKGVLYIHPDLSDQALFFNPNAHKKTIIDFEIKCPEKS